MDAWHPGRPVRSGGLHTPSDLHRRGIPLVITSPAATAMTSQLIPLVGAVSLIRGPARGVVCGMCVGSFGNGGPIA